MRYPSVRLLALASAFAVVAGCFNRGMVSGPGANSGFSPNFDVNRNWRIAVLPPAVGPDVASGGGLYDYAGLKLLRVGRFQVVDRTEVDRVMQELAFQSSGLTDPGTAAKLGRLLGAEAVMAMTVTSVKHDSFFSENPDQHDAKLYVKIISVETAEVLYSAQGQGTSFGGEVEALQSAFDVAVDPLMGKAQGRQP